MGTQLKHHCIMYFHVIMYFLITARGKGSKQQNVVLDTPATSATTVSTPEPPKEKAKKRSWWRRLFRRKKVQLVEQSWNDKCRCFYLFCICVQLRLCFCIRSPKIRLLLKKTWQDHHSLLLKTRKSFLLLLPLLCANFITVTGGFSRIQHVFLFITSENTKKEFEEASPIPDTPGRKVVVVDTNQPSSATEKRYDIVFLLIPASSSDSHSNWIQI